MEKVFQDLMRQRLLAEKKRITDEIEKVAQKTSKDGEKYKAAYPEYGSRDDENAAEVTEFEERLSVGGNLGSMLEKIDVALANLDKGTYGVCDSCKSDIDKARLEANPYANLCISCQEKEESGVLGKIKKFFKR